MANWSRDTVQPMRRRACVYQNIDPVIKHFSQWRTEVVSLVAGFLDVTQRSFGGALRDIKKTAARETRTEADRF